MDGIELVAAQTYLGQLRSQGRAVRPDVQHSVQLVRATPDEAEIHDELLDRGIFIDPITQEPLPPDQQAASPETKIQSDYILRKIDGVWKVVEEG